MCVPMLKKGSIHVKEYSELIHTARSHDPVNYLTLKILTPTHRRCIRVIVAHLEKSFRPGR